MFLVVLALVFSTCAASLDTALAVRARGTTLLEDMSRYVTAPCIEPRVSAVEVDQLTRRGSRYRPFIQCTFLVDGNPHGADSEFTLVDRYRSSSSAVLAGERWLVRNTPLVAYYDPLAPAHATLSREVLYSVTGDIVVAIGGIFVAFGLWIAIVRKIYLRLRAWREARRRPPDEPIPSARVV